MPKFTIDITDAALVQLQKLVDTYNGNNGAALTVADWILLNLREIAIQEDLLAAINTLRDEAQKSAQDAIAAERQRLLGSVM